MLEDFITISGPDLSDDIYGSGYRCSADLIDGTHLPCVILRRPQPTTDLALKRFEQEKSKKRGIFGPKVDGYRKIVEHFVTMGNTVNAYDIKNVAPSRFAIPTSLLKKIEGETVMSWTGWVFEMSDGQKFNFGSTFLFEFFQLPDSYEFDDVIKIHNHSYLDDNGTIRSIKKDREKWLQWTGNDEKRFPVFRERPFFTCYIDASS